MASLAKLGQVIGLLVTNRSGLIIVNKCCGPLLEPTEAIAWQQSIFENTKDDWPELTNETQRVALDNAGRVVVYSGVGDVLVFVTGTEEYEELLLSQTLTLVIAILKLVSAKDKKGIVSQSELIAHYDQLCLMLGTLLHKGILEQTEMAQLELQYKVAYEDSWRRAAKREETAAEDLIVSRLRSEVPTSSRKGKKSK